MASDSIAALTDLVVRSDDFRILSDSRDVYCPFEALGVARHEIRHSNFLSDVLNPEGSHGFGDACLRSFIDTLLEAAGEHRLRLELHVESLDRVEVFREWRDIDLLVRLRRGPEHRDLVIVAELKVEAGESKGQLEKYEALVAAHFPDARALHFLITPDEREPSRPDWTPIGFRLLVDGFENGVLRRREGHATARTMLQAYLAMMRRRYVEDAELEELARRIWAKHGEALAFLMERQPNRMSDLLDALADDMPRAVDSRLAESKPHLVLEMADRNRRQVRFTVPAWDEIEGMRSGAGWVPSNRVCLFELEGTQDRLHVRFVVGRGPEEVRLKFIRALDRIDPSVIEVRRRERITSEFTRVCTKPILTRQRVRTILENGVDEGEFDRIRRDLVDYFVAHIRAFDDAFADLGRERGEAE